jgi:hypothetical protein
LLRCDAVSAVRIVNGIDGLASSAQRLSAPRWQWRQHLGDAFGEEEGLKSPETHWRHHLWHDTCSVPSHSRRAMAATEFLGEKSPRSSVTPPRRAVDSGGTPGGPEVYLEVHRTALTQRQGRPEFETPFETGFPPSMTAPLVRRSTWLVAAALFAAPAVAWSRESLVAGRHRAGHLDARHDGLRGRGQASRGRLGCGPHLSYRSLGGRSCR